MDDILRRSLLYDFYGELLTQRQRKVYQEAVFEDLSLTEIAEEEGISRQGVYDMIRRCDKALREYEEKLGLVERFARTRELVDKIRALAAQCKVTKDMECVDKIERIADEIGEL